MTEVQNVSVVTDIAVMQFGQPYEISGEQFISDRDGVHMRFRVAGTDVLNLRMTPKEAFATARIIAEAAGKAHAAAQRGEGKTALAGIVDLMKED